MLLCSSLSYTRLSLLVVDQPIRSCGLAPCRAASRKTAAELESRSDRNCPLLATTRLGRQVGRQTSKLALLLPPGYARVLKLNETKRHRQPGLAWPGVARRALSCRYPAALAPWSTGLHMQLACQDDPILEAADGLVPRAVGCALLCGYIHAAAAAVYYR
jgi:hypothetical protein